jgi:hypothetical protein
LLDIGGGHAAYSIAFCRRYPDLRAQVIDLPGALAVGRANVELAGISDRISFHSGNWRDAGFGEHDVVLMFNILHGNGVAENTELVRAAAAAVRRGGTVAVLEALTDVPEEAGWLGEAHVRAFGITLFHTQGGQTYRFADVAEWLESAGLADVRVHVLPSAPTEQVVIATKN